VNHLLRQLAPITDSAWVELDQEATQRLGAALATRKLVDYAGPYGWKYSAANLGRVKSLAKGLAPSVTALQRVVLPLVELRADFELSRGELADGERGAPDVDLKALDEAALNIAAAENTAVFHGLEAAGMAGIADSSPQPRIPLGEDCESYPRLVATAVESLRKAGIGGPYGLAVAPEVYTSVIETTEHGGYPLLDHLRHILEGQVVWAPGVMGGVALSLRGGDFLFESGQELSIGYLDHDAEVVRLYLEESFALRIATPEAAVWLTAEK
jgi:uncharacterized linocin/CFP29 family protein